MTPTANPEQSITLPADCRDAAAVLNRGCACVTVDHTALRHALEQGVDSKPAVSYADLLKTRPHLFSDTKVYVAEAHMHDMADLVSVIHRISKLPAWRERVLSYAPASARHATSAEGAFLGFDFHLGAEGPQLIEINTNAGGGLLSAKLLRAQRACCSLDETVHTGQIRIESDFVAMFREEWRLTRGDAPLGRIAIVDDSPATQYLQPEFELFRQLFEASGIRAVVADPGDLSFDGSRLTHDGIAVDLVYNRLTDFPLNNPRNAALRAAYLADAVVLTPHPQAHAIYADKRNLAALTDQDWLQAIGVGDKERQLLAKGIPLTREVLPATAPSFWADRRKWFFKPVAGYGSKAAYRGEKLTKRVFEGINRGGYVAQALVPPSERRLLVDGLEHDLKLDLRNYVYQGRVQLVSARLYRGQTTNFRTPGGGFAAVFAVPCQGDQRVCI